MSERITPEAALKKLAAAGGQRWVTMFQHGNLELEYYAPRDSDPQKPHTRDEVYFILSGSAVFVKEQQRWRVVPGEVLYVPAGVPHHFEDFTEGFACWAIFYPTA